MPPRERVGEVRQSQLLYTFGVGAVVDLPCLSVLVMGIEDWPVGDLRPMVEERLLLAVRQQLGRQMERLCLPPLSPESAGGIRNPFDDKASVGVPVAPFPRWMRCPSCNLLAPLSSGLFELKTNAFRPDQSRYVHVNCQKRGKPPTVLPARFLVACEHGHLDDFPWVHFVHRGEPGCGGALRLDESGVSGEARDVLAICTGCGKTRRMAEAFGEEGRKHLPACRGRRPHLRDFAEDGCKETPHTILLGASNSWFPMTMSALSIPTAAGKLDQLVEEDWAVLEKATSLDVLKAFRAIGQVQALAEFSDEEVWKAIEKKRATFAGDAPAEPVDVKAVEWQAFSEPSTARTARDFRLTEVDPPDGFGGAVSRVVLVERLREVRALVGFTRIGSPGDFTDLAELPEENRGALSRNPPRWVPASEVRGEGIFLHLDEKTVRAWERGERAVEREGELAEAHRRWRAVRRIQNPTAGFPGVRYVLLHTLAHALIRQLAVECGYTAASIRERIYARPPEAEGGPMAGLLLYTAASDSEGTLGGLVDLGRPENLGRHLVAALARAGFCSSDPLCAEHHPHRDGVTLHGAACHACMFLPETSCERGNRYLDRTLLVPTFEREEGAFFAR